MKLFGDGNLAVPAGILDVCGCSTDHFHSFSAPTISDQSLKMLQQFECRKHVLNMTSLQT